MLCNPAFITPSDSCEMLNKPRFARQFSNFAGHVYQGAALTLLSSSLLSAQLKQPTLITTPVMPTTRAEAGVNVLQHDAYAFTRATQLGLVGAPVTTIDGTTLDPAFDLTRTEDVVLLSDGRIAAFSAIGSRFMIFRANGKPERKIGRSGKGPGEFMRARGLMVMPGDTMFLSDPGNRRLNWITPDRGVVLNKPRGNSAIMHSEKAVGVLSTGEVVLSSQGLVQDGVRDRVTRPLAGVVLISRDGTARALTGVPDWEIAMVTMRAPKITYWERTPIQFSRNANVAAWDSSVVSGSGDGYRIDMRDARDRNTARIVVNTSRRTVTAAMRNSWLSQRLGQVRAPRSADEIGGEFEKQFIRETPVADSLPPYRTFHVSPNKTLWVVDYIAPNDTGWSATAFRKDGAIVGRLHVKGRGRPKTFGDDRVVIRTEDDDGVVSLAVYRIGITTAKPK